MKYSLILADVPWPYNSRAPHAKTRFGGGAMQQYPVMTVAEIKALPVSDIAEKDTVLFFWATWPHLETALEVIDAWGFDYKTVGFNWLKQNKRGEGLFFGTGFYSKSGSEPCLLATRGKTLKPASNSISSSVLAPVRAHSQKPPLVHERIEKLYPELTKVELFARNIRPGWTCIGNELTGRDIREDIALLKEAGHAEPINTAPTKYV